MRLKGLRFCHVAEGETAQDIAVVLGKLGLENTMPDGDTDAFPGAVFPNADSSSWVEVWAAGEGMPPGTMLQLVVDDADAVAEAARSGGLDPSGPMDAHGERIYYLPLPGGLMMSFQSALTAD